MSELATAHDLYDYINRVADPHANPMLFWAAFGVSEEAIAEIASVTGKTVNIHPAAALTCMEIGAMIAMRLVEEKEEEST